MSYQDFQPFDTSGISTFTLSASEIIQEALDTVGVGTDGEGIAPEDYARSLRALNLVLRELQAQGLHISSYKTGFMFMTEDEEDYVVEDQKATNEYWQTTLSADATSPTTSITVTDSTNMNLNDTIGILKNDSTIFWSTISTITPTVAPAATVVIADSLDGDADSGCTVVNYTTAIEPIARVLKVLRHENFDTDAPISLLSRSEYEDLPYKTGNSGTPSLAYFDRQRPKGKLFVWPPPDSEKHVMRLWYEARIDDLKTPEDALDMDRAYLPAVVYTLAIRLCDRFGISNEVYQRVKVAQQEIMANVLSYDDEVTPVKVSLQRNSF